MRIALGGVSLTVLVLFYLGVYRPTKSSFSGWWSISLLCAAASTLLLLFNGTPAQIVANPASTVLSVAGATCVWFATRSLRRQKLPLWMLGVAPALGLVPALLDDPANNIWAGNGPMFVYMGALFAAAAAEVWLAWVARRAQGDHELNGEAVVALLVSAIAASALGAYYLMRSVVFLVAGPDSDLFETMAGSGPTTGILLVCLVAVTFSVSAVGWDQQTQELRRRAMEDDLTRLLGRAEFRLQAERMFAQARSNRESAVLVVADLDHFKAVNDAHGHAAGDRALVEFADTLRASLRPGELAGRLGGEEFGLVLLGDRGDEAAARLDAMSADFLARSRSFDFFLPTVSYGITGFEDGDTVAEIFERADMALYRAKADGRDRAVAYTREAVLKAGRLMLRRSTDQDPAEG